MSHDLLVDTHITCISAVFPYQHAYNTSSKFNMYITAVNRPFLNIISIRPSVALVLIYYLRIRTCLAYQKQTALVQTDSI